MFGASFVPAWRGSTMPIPVMLTTSGFDTAEAARTLRRRMR